MLLKDFYSIEKIDQESDQEYTAFIRLNPAHSIFKGHFPDNPVVPGVCMMQVVKELVAKITDRKLVLSSSKNIKFMAIINPFNNPDLRLSILIKEQTEDEIHIRNTTYFEDTEALKMSIRYKIQ